MNTVAPLPRAALLLSSLAVLALPLGCKQAPRRTGLKEVETEYLGKGYAVAHVDLTKADLRLFWKDNRGKPFGDFHALEDWAAERDKWLLFAMNAGMFLPDLSPVGLYVENGKQLRPLNRAGGGKSNFTLKPNGVFALTRRVGTSVPDAQIVETSQYPSIASRTIYATQSGPMLVIGGKLHPAFRRTSTSRLIRNGVGVVSPRGVVFAISEDPVNFHEFATFFREGLHCNNALYLDGNVSSMYSMALKRHDAGVELGPMVGVIR